MDRGVAPGGRQWMVGLRHAHAGPLRHVVGWLVRTTAVGEEDQRRERALQGLLTGSLLLALVAAAQRLPAVLAGGAGAADHRSTLILTLAASGAFCLLFVLSHRSGPVPAAWGLLVTYYLVAAWLYVAEGTEEPTAIVVTAMFVVASGVLIDDRAAIIAVLAATITLVGVSALDAAAVLTPGGATPGVLDQLQLCGGFAAIALVLSARTRERRGSVEQLLSGGSADPPTLLDPRLRTLTVRELQVVRLIAAGHADAVIARELFVSPRTVHGHVSHALRKTGCRNRTELAVLTVSGGLGPPMQQSPAARTGDQPPG